MSGTLISELKSYTAEKGKKDFFAGLTTAILLIPQSMAYALLAGLPAYVGLYAAAIPLLGYAFIGTSRSLAVGPVAMDSLLTAAAVGAIATSGSDEYLALATLLAAMVGVVHVIMALTGMGRLVSLLTRPIISAFTSAAALIIGINQVKLVLGVELPRSTSVIEIVQSLIFRIGDSNIPTVIIGALSIATLLILKKRFPKVPRAFVVVLFGAGAVLGLDLMASGVNTIGEIPGGLPAFALPTVTADIVLTLLPSVIMIAIIAFMESISVSKRLQREGEEVQPNKELMGIGVANLLAGVFQGFPVTGGFSRSAVNDNAGAESQMSALATAFFVVITLLFFTGLLSPIPNAVLGAIIMTAVFSLISISDVREFSQMGLRVMMVYVITFASTLFIGIQEGILFGVLFNVITQYLCSLFSPEGSSNCKEDLTCSG